MIEWDPTERLDVANEAVPLVSVLEPSTVVPSRKVTVPVARDGDTVAVKVTVCPRPDGFRLDFTVVVVLAVLTVCATTGEVLPEYAVLPL